MGKTPTPSKPKSNVQPPPAKSPIAAEVVAADADEAALGLEPETDEPSTPLPVPPTLGVTGAAPFTNKPEERLPKDAVALGAHAAKRVADGDAVVGDDLATQGERFDRLVATRWRRLDAAGHDRVAAFYESMGDLCLALLRANEDSPVGNANVWGQLPSPPQWVLMGEADPSLTANEAPETAAARAARRAERELANETLKAQQRATAMSPKGGA